MRIPALVLLALLSCPGVAAALGETTPGLAAKQAVAMAGFSKEAGWSHPLAHSIPAEAWRGKRVRLTLSLRNDVGVRMNVALLIAKRSGVFLSALPRSNPRGSDAWKTHLFVMDVPDDATQLAVRVNVGGKGVAWLDNIKFEAADVPVSVSRRESEPTLFNQPRDAPFGN